MFNRIIKPLKYNSFFIFGPRGTGKTTFLKDFFSQDKVVWIDLLQPSVEERYARNPESLIQELEGLKKPDAWVVIDEIQKVPKLLDLVHFHIEKTSMKFALTGSSARKLKKGSANLLAGRAFMNSLFPLTHSEMGDAFRLEEALRWGTFPKVTQFGKEEEKREFLLAYALTYPKEEIWAEHIIRQLDPFRRFLEIAAQTNGQIVNFSNIAKDVGADTKTVQSYFQILEDTLIGILLEPFHTSIRKRQRKNPKFYFFDPGVKRALDRTLDDPLLPNSTPFGNAFEHFVILEIHRLNEYHRKNYRLAYLRTKDDAEIDLILERPGMPLALIEIKSTEHVDERSTRTLERFVKDFERAEAFCLSRDPRPKKIGAVTALPWDQGLREIGIA